MQNKTNNSKPLDEMTIDEYIEYLEDTQIGHSTTPVSVSDWNKLFSNRKIVANHEYQREEGAWKVRLQKGLIFSLLRRQPVPPIITVFNYETQQKEIVDGQHRLIAIRDFHTGKVPLPRFVPEKFGGGKTIQDVHPKLVERIDGAYITDMILQSPNLNTNGIKDVYSSLQKSVLLTLGQEVRAKHGSYRELINDLAKNPLCSKFGQKADKELQFASYIVAYTYQKLNNRAVWFKKPVVLDLLEDLEGEQCSNEIRVRCFQLIDVLDEVVQDIKLSNFYAISLLMSIGELMITKGVPIQQIKNELRICFRNFWDLCQKIRFDEGTLDYNNRFIISIRDVIKSQSSVDNSKKLIELSDLLLEVWENEGILPI